MSLKPAAWHVYLLAHHYFNIPFINLAPFSKDAQHTKQWKKSGSIHCHCTKTFISQFAFSAKSHTKTDF